MNEDRYSEDKLTISTPLLMQSTTAEKQSSFPITPSTKKTRRCNLSTDHWHQILHLIPKYKKLSINQFKAVLTEFISRCDFLHTKEWLSKFSILQFLQKHADFLSTVSQLRVEQNYWNDVINIMTSPTVCMSGVSKDFTTKNSINWDHSRTEQYIERRKNNIQNKLQQVESNLNSHLQQTFPFYWQIKNAIPIDYFMNIISTAMTTLVEYNLRYLRTNFEQKKILWHFAINDIHLVKSFHGLNPTEEQVRIRLIETNFI